MHQLARFPRGYRRMPRENPVDTVTYQQALGGRARVLSAESGGPGHGSWSSWAHYSLYLDVVGLEQCTTTWTVV